MIVSDVRVMVQDVEFDLVCIDKCRIVHVEHANQNFCLLVVLQMGRVTLEVEVQGLSLDQRALLLCFLRFLIPLGCGLNYVSTRQLLYHDY